ncbi:MAG TPA: metal-sensitive transcriptional regulator [Firmicutes bacterium]|nr:metal-sensitive transcriptional regulator [Bacillota bacterium]HHY99130.1 metal-sensitive transcriptional regulator [Bacillota bacterium]
MKKIEGQARGIQKMIAEGRTCSDIIVQLSAMKSAIDQVAVSILARYMADCLDRERAQGKDIKAALEEFLPVFRKFS